MSDSAIKSALLCKCPQCRKGDIFPYSAYSFKFHKINIFCPECDVRFEVEPGFFIGAMYVNYGFTVIQVLTVGVLFNVFNPEAVIWDFMTFTLLSIFIFLPITLRLSKSLYLYWFSSIKYNSNK